MVWTQFWDMHSGGGPKEKYAMIYIEAPETEAISVFYSKFGHSPNRVSCTCCGEDYSISESATLADATGYHRGLRTVERANAKKGWPDTKYIEPGENIPRGWKLSKRQWGGFGSDTKAYSEGMTVEEYVQAGSGTLGGGVLIITEAEISASDRTAYVPEQGYVWQ